MKALCRTAVVLSLLVSLASGAGAQMTLGTITLEREPAEELLSPPVVLPGIMFSQAILSVVGGVAFERTAQPLHPSALFSLELGYDPALPDGHRLVLKVNGERKQAVIFDWMLVPIARYAESDYLACFTYFGHLRDRHREEAVLSRKGRIVNYHPAFDNTLLGLRLMQTDLMLMYNDCADLPKEKGEYILGGGETRPEYFRNAIGFNNILLHLHDIENDLGFRFRSYLISDYSREIRFSFPGDTLVITGDPFFYCWRYRYDGLTEAEQHAAQEAVTSAVDAELERMLDAYPDGEYSQRQWYNDRVLAEMKRYEGQYDLYAAGTVVDCLALEGDSARSAFLDRYTTGSLRQLLISLRYNMDMHECVFLDEYSRRLSADPDFLRAMNPAVWDAATATLRYAAFFRFVRERSPEQWRRFSASVRDVPVLPPVRTPTVMWSPNGQ
ncbi:hypothetical protein JXO52_12340 [bacterium]|nr:hypothetical protein [bacterium]